jgi:hypothetical protein
MTHDVYISHPPELPVEVKEWDREPVRALPQVAGLPRKPSRGSGRERED